ncbi:2OG-Fe(II) oxygenase family protein [Pacificimonas sp. ICDLI1SI03]
MRESISQTKLQEELRQAMALAQGGDFRRAEACLNRILAAAPTDPDALQLLGMVARKRGDQIAAAKLFRQSLAARPHQYHVLNNLGNCLIDLGRPEEAARAYTQALELKSDYIDARLNLALAQMALGHPSTAYETVKPLARVRPEDARVWGILGQALGAMNAGGRAVDAYQTALRLRPGHAPWLHNLALALRSVGRAEEALPILSSCAIRSPSDARIHYNLGNCLQDLGHIKEAEAAYRRALQLTPTDVAVHDSLCRLLWQHGQRGDHLKSYRAALVEHGDDPGLLTGLAYQLTLGGDAQEAVNLLAPAAECGVGGADLQYRLGQALWSAGKPDKACNAFDRALSYDPEHAATLKESARSLIIMDRTHDAVERIKRRLAADPADQQALALQGIAWRLSGDTRAAALHDPDLIGTFALKPSDGDAATFNQHLDTVLTGLHHGRQHPLEQTLRGGTQTTDDLFTRALPEVAAVRTMIEHAVHDYISGLPDDPAHPFLCRKTSNFAFSGSWSVRLYGGGHHTNHIHPEGWVSAVYYVALHDAAPAGREGWLKFGESGLNLGDREELLCAVRPETGLLVLFPSYFYHGTYPFSGNGHRTTIAFDIIPAR